MSFEDRRVPHIYPRFVREDVGGHFFSPQDAAISQTSRKVRGASGAPGDEDDVGVIITVLSHPGIR